MRVDHIEPDSGKPWLQACPQDPRLCTCYSALINASSSRPCKWVDVASNSSRTCWSPWGWQTVTTLHLYCINNISWTIQRFRCITICYCYEWAFNKSLDCADKFLSWLRHMQDATCTAFTCAKYKFAGHKCHDQPPVLEVKILTSLITHETTWSCLRVFLSLYLTLLTCSNSPSRSLDYFWKYGSK